LAKELGYHPASLVTEDVARYREQIADRKAREEAGIREVQSATSGASGITSRRRSAVPR
jgi:hypothetical protein